MNEFLKGELANSLTTILINYYHLPVAYESICKMKIYESIKLMTIFATDPQQLIMIAGPTIENVAEK